MGQSHAGVHQFVEVAATEARELGITLVTESWIAYHWFEVHVFSEHYSILGSQFCVVMADIAGVNSVSPDLLGQLLEKYIRNSIFGMSM